MADAYESICKHFDEHELNYLGDEELQRVQLFARWQGVPRALECRVRDGQLFHTTCSSGITVPEGARAALSEAIAKANYRIKLGYWQLDWSDGELTFQVVQVLEDGAYEIAEGTLLQCVVAALSTCADFADAFNSIIYGNEDADTALGRVFDNSRDDEDDSE